MTLDEAIQHCEEKACSNTMCGREHLQLAAWLKELKEIKEMNSSKSFSQSKAREIFDSKSYNEIMSKIEAAAYEGKYNWIWYNGGVTDTLKKKLGELGYNINDHIRSGKHGVGIQIFF